MRLGIYCGSFNPVHVGHIRIAKECIRQKLVDKVMIIATGSYWDKKDLMPLKMRLDMLRLVSNKNIIIDDKYNDIPYTYQIFRKLKEDRPDDEFVFILGADNLLKFEDWKEYKEILKYDFIVVGREDIDVAEQMKRLHKENYVILDVEKMDISSTFIRNNLHDYEAVKDMVDEKVYRYLLNMEKVMTQHEITNRHELLDEKGHLKEVGYAKSLILDYDRSSIKANSLRIKEWDYYLIYNDRYAVALTVDDNSYMALDSISLIDFEKKWEHTNSPMKFMTLGKRNFPVSSKSGDVKGEGKDYKIEFIKKENERILNFQMDNFLDGKPIGGSISLKDPDDESMVIVTPYKESKVHFYYNQKINCMPASGKVSFDGRDYIFDQSDSFGTLDWGRGVWTYKNTWYWGSASRMIDGHRFGFNIGYGFGDTSAASENMLFYDGKAHKLSHVTFNIPLKDGKEDYLKPWTFTSDDGRFEMDFEPVLDRASNTDFVILGSDQHQVFGKYSGKAILDDGKVIEVKDFMGFAEKVTNKW